MPIILLPSRWGSGSGIYLHLHVHCWPWDHFSRRGFVFIFAIIMRQREECCFDQFNLKYANSHFRKFPVRMELLVIQILDPLGLVAFSDTDVHNKRKLIQEELALRLCDSFTLITVKIKEERERKGTNGIKSCRLDPHNFPQKVASGWMFFVGTSEAFSQLIHTSTSHSSLQTITGQTCRI